MTSLYVKLQADLSGTEDEVASASLKVVTEILKVFINVCVPTVGFPLAVPVCAQSFPSALYICGCGW